MDQIVHARPRTYRPIVEYGGWVIRFACSGNGRAYNAYGNRGVHLDLTTGRHALIGSENPEQLAAAIERAHHPTITPINGRLACQVMDES